MPRSNPHARERVKDDEKHLDSLAHPFPFAGRGTSGESPAGSSQGSALQAPRRAIGDQEMLETQRVGALLQREELLHSGLSARADERNRSQGRRTRHQHGSLCSRWSAAMSTAASNRNVGQRPFVLPCGHILLQQRVATARGLTAIRRPWVLAVRLHGRPEQRGTDLSPGRAHDRIVVAEIGRTASSSWKRAESGRPGCERKRNAVEGNLGGAIVARPMEGALDHPTRGSFHGTCARRWSRPLARRLLLFQGKGDLLSRKRRGQAACGDGSVRG